MFVSICKNTSYFVIPNNKQDFFKNKFIFKIGALTDRAGNWIL